ncbi:hypothetical protein GCM10010412_066040 [Nonomuraea recticatena]|uniref:Uncharacterized protein n=1 Tax=Nonomuraea recticatena TaxID=46178 RepID=A0ABN3SNI4_9ACTN
MTSWPGCWCWRASNEAVDRLNLAARARDVQKLGGSTRRGEAREHTEDIPRVTTVASRPDTLIREKTVVRYLRKTAFIVPTS